MADSDPNPLPIVILFSVAGIGVTFVVVLCVAAIFFIPQVPEFRVESASFAIGTGDSQPIAATLAVTARNPNKRLSMVAYGGLEVFLVEVRAGSLFGKMLPPFTLEAKSETTLLANFSVSGENGGAAARFDLRMECGVHFDEASLWGWLGNKEREMQLKVLCGEISTNGISPRVCRVDALLGRYFVE